MDLKFATGPEILYAAKQAAAGWPFAAEVTLVNFPVPRIEILLGHVFPDGRTFKGVESIAITLFNQHGDVALQRALEGFALRMCRTAVAPLPTR